jgi:predicted transcriptional regulator
MNIEQLAATLRALHAQQMSEVDILILSAISQAEGADKTVMNIIQKCPIASRQTVHKRIQWLCKKGIINKIEQPGNMRFKRLEFGPAYLSLLTELRAA